MAITPELLSEMEEAVAFAKTMGEIKSTGDLSNLMSQFISFADTLNAEATELEYRAKKWRERAKTALEYYRTAKAQQSNLRELQRGI